MLAKEFGKRLRLLREQRFLSQRQLAEGIKAEPAHISRYERGLFLPNAETLIELARFLRVSVGMLLLGEEENIGGADQPIGDVTLLERFRELEKLSRKDREIVVALIDAIITSRQHEEVSSKRVRRSA